MPKKITPICRYGHGELMIDADDSEPRLWALLGVKKMGAGSSGHTAMMPTGSSYSFVMYQCRVCGYIELFDDEA